MRALVALATVRAWVGRDVDDPRSPTASTGLGNLVYHVPVNTFFHSLSSESKDTRDPVPLYQKPAARFERQLLP
jgi:hypothetical protein